MKFSHLPASEFAKKIIKWYRNSEQRRMPWLKEKDPYKIWISEIMLQQTSVEQVIPYYNKFLEKFPDISSLADADRDEVLHLWQGLGYNSRARHLHEASIQLSKEHDEEFPRNYEEILELKGIGDYTASAITSFAYDAPYYVIDTNVKRILARVFNLTENLDRISSKRKISAYLEEAGRNFSSSEFNQAIMNFGATVCDSRKPLCTSCPLNDRCIANEKNIQLERPVRKKKKARKKRYFHWLLCQQDDSILIEKRTRKDIWQGMYHLPLIEKQDSSKPEKKELKKLFPEAELNNLDLSLNKTLEQTLSHQKIIATIYNAPFPDAFSGNYLKVSASEINNYAIPGILRRYFSSN